MSRAVLPAHGKDTHRCNGPDGIPVLLHILVVGDEDAVTAGAGRTITITGDLSGTHLREAHAVIVGAAASDIEVSVENLTEVASMLVDPIVIDSGDLDSYESSSPSVIDDSGTPPANRVLRGDKVRVEVVDAGGGAALGLEVQLEFGPRVIEVTP